MDTLRPRPARESYPFRSHRTIAETTTVQIAGERFVFIPNEDRKAIVEGSK